MWKSKPKTKLRHRFDSTTRKWAGYKDVIVVQTITIRTVKNGKLQVKKGKRFIVKFRGSWCGKLPDNTGFLG